MSIRPALAIAAALLCAGAGAQTTALPPPVVERASASGISLENIGAIVQRVGDPIPSLVHSANRPFQPASTLKLLTAIVALDTLGPAYRARTELRASGRQRGSTWVGDLVLRGGGDMDFDARALEGMLLRLRAQGVRRIEGDVVLDRSFYAPERTDVGLAPFDETPEFRYNVIPDALVLDMGLHRLALSSIGGRMQVESLPAMAGVSFRARMDLIDAPCVAWEDTWKLPEVRRGTGDNVVVTLHGAFPRECAAATEIAVLDRDEYIARAFRETWRRMGGSLRGRVREGRAPDDAVFVAEHRSRALGEVVRDIAKRSDNPVTRMTWLTLGALATGAGEATTADRAERVVREWLAKRAIPAEGLVLENGSGLSRRERISPATLAATVVAAMQSPWWLEFASSLPIAGVDGGMRRRLSGTPAATKARIKTGTLRDTWAVAGFVDVEGRGRYVVVAMINDAAAGPDDARATLDALIAWVASGEASP